MTSSSSDSDFHVTFSLPSSAAALLKELADGGNQGLRDLGVVSVHINSSAFHEAAACAVPPRKSAMRESDAPLSANTSSSSSHLDKLSLSCHSFPAQDDLENTRQNIRHYLTMQMTDTGGNVDYAVPNSNASTPMQPPQPPPLDMPRHIPDMRPVNTLGHSLLCADASQLPVGHRMDAGRGPMVSDVDHGHQKRNADAECWKPACSSYWNWQQNPYRLAYADVAVDGYGSHSGLARPVSPMYARSPPYAFNSCSPRMRTGYQMLPPSHFQQPVGHAENERAWQHTNHTTTSPYLMNLLHSNSSHAARNQRLAGPFETVLALPPGQTKKKFHRSRKDVTLTSRSHAGDSSSALGSGSPYDGPGPVGFGPDHSSFAFPMAAPPHSGACRPDVVEQQNQQIYAAAQSAYYVNKSQANAFSAPSHVVSTSSCLVTSPPPAFAMPMSAHAATTATFVTSPSDSLMLTPAHAMLTTTTCAASTSRVGLASTCSESPRATDKSAAVGQLTSTSTKSMSSPTHAVSTLAHPLSASHVFMTSPHVMSTPRHALYTSARAISPPRDVISVPLRHVTPVSSQNVSETSENAVLRPVQVTSVGITSPALAISTMKHSVANAAPGTATRTNVISPLASVGSAHITPQFGEQQYFRSNYYSGRGFGAADEYRPDWGSKSKSVHCSFKETTSTNLNTSSHAEQLCNGELEKFPDLTQRTNKTTCSVGRNLPMTILPAVHFMESKPIRDQDLMSRNSELMSVRERLSADIVANPVRDVSNDVITKAIISRKPEDAESQPDSKASSSIYNPSSIMGEMLQDTLSSVSSSVSSSRTNEMTSTDGKGSISATTINQTPISIAALHTTKETSLHGEMLCNLDIVNVEYDHGKKMQDKSEENNTMSPLLPPIISNSCIGEKAAEEMTVSMHGVASSTPTTVVDDDEQATFHRVNVVVLENFNGEKLTPDGSKATVSIGKQSVCIDTETIESFKPTVDTFVTTSDGALGSNGMVHEKDDSLDLADSIERTITDNSQKDDHSQQAVVNSSFQTKSDANFVNEVHESADGADETSATTKIDAENTLLSAPKMQIQNAYSDVITPGNTEQLNCSNGKEIRSNITVSSNGVEPYDAARTLHDDENVCGVIADDALRLPMSTVKTPIDTTSNQTDNFSDCLLRNAGNENLAVNVESASQDIDLLDGQVKLVAGVETKNCTDNADGKALELVDSEGETMEECVQTAQVVNLRLKLHKEELIQKVSDSFEEKKSHVSILGELCSVPVLQRCSELLQKTTDEDEDEDGQRSHSPRTAGRKEVSGLIKPGIVDSITTTTTIASPSEECGQKNNVVDVSSSGDERNFLGTASVFKCTASSICEPSTSDAMAALHSEQVMANCNALLPAASTCHDSNQVKFDGTVSEPKNSSDRIQPRERCKSADFDVTALSQDAGSSCHGVGIQSNGLIPEMTDGLNFSESHSAEQLRMVVPPRTVSGSSRHCVADVGPVSRCFAQTVSTFALNSPLRKEVSLSSDAPPSSSSPPLPLSCLTVEGDDEQCDREHLSQRNYSSGFDESSSAMHSRVLHSDSKTVSLSVTPVAESSSSLTSVSLEIVASSASKSDTSHSCVRQSPVSCVSLSAHDQAYFGNDAKSSVFDEDAQLSGPLPAKRLRTSDTN